MTFIENFISAINDQVKASLCQKAVCFYGLTQPGLLKDGKRTPVYYSSGEGKRIQFNDQDSVTIYHRLISVSTQEVTGSPGDNVLYTFEANLRMFILLTLVQLDPGCNEGPDGIAFSVWDSIPKTDGWHAENASMLKLRTDQLSTDTRTIIGSEFTGLDESKINALTVGAFAINYRITGRFCGNFCDIGEITYE